MSDKSPIDPFTLQVKILEMLPPEQIDEILKKITDPDDYIEAH